MNWPTFIIAAIVAVIFVAIVFSEIRKRKSGRGSCSCGGSCGACPMGASCHSATPEKK